MKKLLFLTVLLVLSLAAGGCGVLETGESRGGVLNLTGIDPITLDPAVSGDVTSHEYIMQVFSGLVRLDDNLEPAPDIAERWQMSDDGRTYTFYLRQDVKFHDGRLVKAEDFKYSWERAFLPETGSHTASTFLGDVSGAADVIAGRTAELTGVKVLDDYTLQVTIDAPKAYFLYRMSYPTAFVVDRNNVAAGRNWWRQPNGTGPFRLKQWDPLRLIVLERNDLYYGHKAGVGSVVFQLWAGNPMNLYETGRIDVASVSLAYIDRVTDQEGPFYRQFSSVPELSFSYIGFNATRPPFDDANIRRAFVQSVNKDKLVSLVFRNMVPRADGILPPGMPGYNQGLVPLPFDVNRARALIAQSKYGSAANLPPITLTTSGWGGEIAGTIEAILHEWRQNLGVEVRVRQLEPERFLYELAAEKDELFDMGWVADYPHPQDFLEVLFRTGSENNYSGYSNPEVDALLDKAAAAQGDGWLALYQQAEQKLVDDAAALPLWFGKGYVLVKPYVAGYSMTPMGFARLNQVFV
ncbi:MAG: peptide ABC transporter substrate-binding protein, partial [Chloroflexi bacterium]|nr:peptide ABC transporter substrate-binding protein [Chloroflexota bacterium]